jgi:hypothetical protein
LFLHFAAVYRVYSVRKPVFAGYGLGSLETFRRITLENYYLKTIFLVNKAKKLFLFTACGTYPEDVEPVRLHRKPGIPGQSGHVGLKPKQFQVQNHPAAGADHMGMGFRPTSIVPVALLAKRQLQNFAFVLEQTDGLVDRGEAGGGVDAKNLVMDLFHRGMPAMSEEGPDDGQTLRREAFAMTFQAVKERCESVRMLH